MSEETSHEVGSKAARLVKELDAVLKLLKKVERLLARHRRDAASVAMSALTQRPDKGDAE